MIFLRTILLSVPVLLSVLTGQKAFSQSNPFSYSAFENIGILHGTWQSKGKDAVTYESWEKQQGVFLGKSYKITGSDTILLEKVRIYFDQGSIVYAPTVQGQNGNQEVQFRLKEIKQNWYIFENKEHDFPQRVAYKLDPSDMLHTYIEGEANGKIKRIVFNYEKVPSK